MPPLLLKLIFDRIGSGRCRSSPSRSRAASRAKVKALMVEPNLKRQLDFMESELAQQRVVRGRRVQRRRHPDELSGRGGGACAPGSTRAGPKLMAFLQKIHARPAYRRALERGGPYSFAND